MRRDRAQLPSPGAQAEPPGSPCVQLCALDTAGICLGCGRSLDEIAQWGSAPAATRWDIWLAARERLALRQAPLGHDPLR